MHPTTIAEQLFFATVYISAQTVAGQSWVGTAFLISHPVADGTSIFLVTNKHVLEQADQLDVRLVRKDAHGGPDEGATQLNISDFSAGAWVGHPDPAVDVAVMPFRMILNQMIEQGGAPYFIAIGHEHLMTTEQEASLDAIEAVGFIGYPSGLFDTANFLPIARIGHTASPPINNYRGHPAFLIDASVYPGSSGSPVYILNTLGWADKNGTINYGAPRFILMGVLAAVHERQLLGEVVDMPTKLVALTNSPINLGIVFKASAIQTCVNELVAKYGPVSG